jgi:hypothetical protein
VSGEVEDRNGGGRVSQRTGDRGGRDAVGWQVCEGAVEAATVESVVDRDIPGSEGVVGGGVG